MIVVSAASRKRRSLLALVTFSLAAFAACRDLTGPRDAMVGAPAERSAMDSPDLVTLTLPAADPWNGRSSLGPSIYGTYTKPTVVRITASGFHNRTPNYSIIGGAVSMGPSGNTGVSIGASSIAVTQGGSVEPSATVYATVTGNLTGAQRYGYSEREYAGFFGVWCGRTYGNRCDDWTGRTTVAVERLQADLSVTPEFTTVAYGATPYFDYRASPMTLENGQSTPFIVDSTHWEPDFPTVADTAVHHSGRGACQAAYDPACRRKLFSSGTFTMSAWVNGARYTKSVHVVVTAPELVVSCTPSTLLRGQQVTCKGTLEPVGPFKVIGQMATSTFGGPEPELFAASYPAGGEHQWPGIVAAPTRVDMIAVIPDGRIIAGSGGFSVIPRVWPDWQLAAPTDLGYLRRNNMKPTLWHQSELVLADFVLHDLAQASVTVDSIGSGPNAGFTFVRERPPLSGSSIAVHPDLKLGTFFYGQQTGPDSLCTPQLMPTLVARVKSHEGLTMADSSHWGISNRALMMYDPQVRVEAVVERDIPSVKAIVPIEFDEWKRGGQHASDQIRFDNVDRPEIQKICTLRTR